MADKKIELIQKMMDVEYYPPSEFSKMNIDIKESKKFPIEKLATLGVAFQPLTQLTNFVLGSAGQSGLYFVDTAGKTMFQSGGKYIGNLPAANGSVGGGLARMTQLPLDPTMLCMAIAIMTVEKKLNSIYEVQKEILAFLEMKEQAKLKGNLNTLADVLNNYKFNWDNEKYKEHKHILVQDIKREAEQSIILYQEQLVKMLRNNKRLHSNQNIKSVLNKRINCLNDYQLSLYIFSFSSFLEVMLLENFDSNYLNSVSGKIQEYLTDYFTLYDECVDKAGNDSKTSIEGYALKGLSKLSNEAGKLVEKIPVVSKSQLDENLIKASGILQKVNTDRTEKIMQILADSQINYIDIFIENIQNIDSLYNQPQQLMFDAENIYVTSTQMM